MPGFDWPGSETFDATATGSAWGLKSAATRAAATARAREAARGAVLERMRAAAEGDGPAWVAGPVELRLEATRLRRFLFLLLGQAHVRATVTAFFRPPPITNATFEIDIEKGAAIPDRLDCGPTHVFAVSVKTAVATCEGYSFGLLYRHAFRYAMDRLAGIACAAACPQPNLYIVAQRGVCAGGFATVSLRMAFRCIGENEAPILGLPIRKDSELGAAFDDELPGAPEGDGERLEVVLTPDRRAEDCPYVFHFDITVREAVQACAALANFAPFVAKAERQAAKIGALTECGPNCFKHPIENAVALPPTCEHDVVTVHYRFEVPCRPEPPA